MNYRMIAYLTGMIILILAAFLLLPGLVALIYAEQSGLWFLATAAGAALLGGLLLLLKPRNRAMYAREGFVVTAMAWILISLIGAAPFTLSGQISKICANRGIAPDIINYYNRADMAVLAINSGVGIAILPPHLKNFYNCPNVVTLPINGDDARITMVVAWQRSSGNPDVPRFLALNSLAENKFFSLYK